MTERLIPGVGYSAEVSDEALIPGVGYSASVSAASGTASGGTGTGTGSGSGGDASGDASATAQGGTGTGTGSGSGGDASSASSIVIRDDYERSSVDLSNSVVTGTGDDALITIRPRACYSIAAYLYKWVEPSARIDGVNGLRPTFRFTNYMTGNYGMTGFQDYYGWAATRRPHYSYDRITWYPFDTAPTRDYNNQRVDFRNSTAFTQDTVYIGRSWQYSVHQAGDWLDAMESAHSGVFSPAPSALAYTPTGNVSGYSGQSFIAEEFASRINEIGGTVPITPFYAAQINDTSLMPTDGSPKRLAIVMSGVHACEDIANYALESFVDYFLGSSDEAVALRRRYKLLIYPMMNAPGRAGGHYRGAYFTQADVDAHGGDDLNRQFSNGSTTIDTVTKPRAAIVTDKAGDVPDWFIDMHCTYDGRWGVYCNTEYPIQDLFRTRLATATSKTITNLGTSVSTQTTEYYFRNLGSKMAVTWELGDDAPQSATEIEETTVGIFATISSLIDDGYIIPDAVATGGTGIGVGSGSGGDATGQISATADGGTGTGAGLGTGGEATGEVGGSATASGGIGTGTSSGTGGTATGQISATVQGGTGIGTGTGTGGDATGGAAGVETWPLASDVRLGVTYGPTGSEFVGSMIEGGVLKSGQVIRLNMQPESRKIIVKRI